MDKYSDQSWYIWATVYSITNGSSSVSCIHFEETEPWAISRLQNWHLYVLMIYICLKNYVLVLCALASICFFSPDCIDLILICQGGNVCASVCLLDCQQDYTKTTKQICMKLGWLTVLDPQETTFGFGADLDKRDGSRRRVLGLSRHLR